MAFEGNAEIKPCLSDETIAAYIDHTLSQAERNRVIAHMAQCWRCIGRVAGTAQVCNQLFGGRQ